MKSFERFEALVNRILSGTTFPTLKWGTDTADPNFRYSANKSTSQFKCTEENLKKLAAFVNEKLQTMDLQTPFPFVFRAAKTAQDTFRIGYDTKSTAPILTAFFNQYDANTKSIQATAYQHPSAPDKIVLHTRFKVTKSVPPVDARKHVVFLLDVSDSMNTDDKIGKLKHLVKHAINNLSAEDTFSIVTFNDEAKVLCTKQGKDTFKSAILDEVKALSATNLLKPFQLLKSSGVMDPNERNVVTFVTDGEHTDRTQDAATIPEEISALLPPNASLVTIGIGEDYNEDMIRKLSDLASNPLPIHIKDDKGFEVAYRMLHTLSMPKTEPAKIQFINGNHKTTLKKTGFITFNIDLEEFFECDKAALDDQAEILIIDAKKQLSKVRLNDAASLSQMPPVVLIAWIRQRINAILLDRELDNASAELQLKSFELMMATHLNLNKEDEAFTAVQDLKALIQEAQLGLVDEDARRNGAFLSNPTQASHSQYFAQMGAQPLSWRFEDEGQSVAPSQSQDSQVLSRSSTRNKSLAL